MSKPSSRPFLTAMAVWFVVACAAGASGRVAALAPPLPQVMIGALTLALIASGALHPGLRACVGDAALEPVPRRQALGAASGEHQRQQRRSESAGCGESRAHEPGRSSRRSRQNTST